MQSRAQRLARGWIVGLIATTVAAVSHSLAVGYQPSLLSVGAALVFAVFLGTAVIGRRPSLPRLTIAVGLSQLAFHLLFSLIGSGGTALTATGSGMADMASPNITPIGHQLAMSGHDHLVDPSMWISHALAAVLTVLFLRHAELAVWNMLTRLVTVVVARITVAAAPAPASEPAGLPAELPAVRPLASRLVESSASRRGPPLLSF